MEVRAGSMLASRYQIRSLLGEGGMGSVWSARDLTDDRAVAIKVLKPGKDDHHRRLRLEARIMKRLTHPNVLRVHDVLVLPNEPPLIVSELLSGESLRARLQRCGAFSLGQAARIILDVTAGVRAAHALGVVHRDLKPDNVFLHDAGASTTVKVLDFGIAKRLATSDGHDVEFVTEGRTHDSKTETGAMLGTPHYMAPEQIFGEADIDERADVWALGVMLFECVVGTRPFFGENAGQVFKAITMGSAPTVPSGANLAPEFVALIERMLQRPREGRPSLDEVTASLEPFADATVHAHAAPETRLEHAHAIDEASHASAPGQADLPLRSSIAPPSKRPLARRWAALAFAAAGLSGAFAIYIHRAASGVAEQRVNLASTAAPPAFVVSTPNASLAEVSPPPIDNAVSIPPQPAKPRNGAEKRPTRNAVTSSPRPGQPATPRPEASLEEAPRRLAGGVLATSPY